MSNFKELIGDIQGFFDDNIRMEIYKKNRYLAFAGLILGASFLAFPIHQGETMYRLLQSGHNATHSELVFMASTILLLFLGYLGGDVMEEHNIPGLKWLVNKAKGFCGFTSLASAAWELYITSPGLSLSAGGLAIGCVLLAIGTYWPEYDPDGDDK